MSCLKVPPWNISLNASARRLGLVSVQPQPAQDSDCWVIVGDQASRIVVEAARVEQACCMSVHSHGEVLDVTNFLADHPGGKKSIMMFAGKDATEECLG